MVYLRKHRDKWQSIFGLIKKYKKNRINEKDINNYNDKKMYKILNLKKKIKKL